MNILNFNNITNKEEFINKLSKYINESNKLNYKDIVNMLNRKLINDIINNNIEETKHENIKSLIKEIFQNKIKTKKDIKLYLNSKAVSELDKERVLNIISEYNKQKINEKKLFSLIKELDNETVINLINKLKGNKNKKDVKLATFIKYFYNNFKTNPKIKIDIPKEITNWKTKAEKIYNTALLNLKVIRNAIEYDKVLNIYKEYDEVLKIIADENDNNELKLDKNYNIYNLKNKVFTEKEYNEIIRYFSKLYEQNENSDDYRNILKKEYTEKVLNFFNQNKDFIINNDNRKTVLLNKVKNIKKEEFGTEIKILRNYIQEVLIPSYKISYILKYLRNNNTHILTDKEQKELINEGLSLIKEIESKLTPAEIVKNYYLDSEDKMKTFIKNIQLLSIQLEKMNLSKEEKEIYNKSLNNLKNSLYNNVNNSILSSKLKNDFEFFNNIQKNLFQIPNNQLKSNYKIKPN